MVRLNRACPLLPAPDVPAAAAWYRDTLGFSVRLARDDYAIVERDDVELHLWACEDRRLAGSTSAYLRVDSIEVFRAALPEHLGQGRISGIEERPWGMREFYVWDPSGNLLRFGEPMGADGVEKAPSTKDQFHAFEALSPAEQKRQTAAAAAALREGRI
jgi:catechol 2,3-dioxygenase-like lactoylglutathione lyase family enzyme